MDAKPLQGCGPDCRAAEQGYPAPCEMYQDDHHAGCPRQSKAECCGALTLHAYDCNRVARSSSGERFGEDETRWEVWSGNKLVGTSAHLEGARAQLVIKRGVSPKPVIVRAVTTRTIEPSSTQGVNNG
jgi:hypothetical protein